MAIFTSSSIVSNIRGSIGGVVFTRSRAGAVARSRVKPTFAVTTALAQQRAIHSVKVAYWRDTLTNARRLVWNTAAANVRWVNALGEEYSPSGFQLFLRQAQQAPSLSTTFPLAPVYPLKTPQLPLLLSWDEPTDRVYLDTPTNVLPAANGYLSIWRTIALPPTYYHVSGPWLWRLTASYTAGNPISGFIFTGPYERRPARMYFRIRTATARFTRSDPYILGISIPPIP